MRLTVIGCSDAFGSGGRYHSCYLLDTAQGRLMLDCGANSPLALKRAGTRSRRSTLLRSAIAMATTSAACLSCFWNGCFMERDRSRSRFLDLPA